MKFILRADLGAGLGGADVAGEGWGEELEMAFPQTPPQSPFQKLGVLFNSSEEELTQCGNK